MFFCYKKLADYVLITWFGVTIFHGNQYLTFPLILTKNYTGVSPGQ